MLPAILGLAARAGASTVARGAGGRFVGATLGGKLRTAAGGALKRSIRAAPSRIMHASGGSKIPALQKAMSLGSDAYGAVSKARGEIAARDKRSAQRKASKAAKAEGGDGQTIINMNQTAAENNDRRESAETANAIRQEKAQQEGTKVIAEESNHALTAMANDVAQIKEALSNSGEQKEESSWIGNLGKILMGVFTIGIGLLTTKLTAIVGEFGAKLGLDKIAKVAGGIGSIFEKAGGAVRGGSAALSRAGEALSTGPGSLIRRAGSYILPGTGPLGAVAGAMAGNSHTLLSAAGKATSGNNPYDVIASRARLAESAANKAQNFMEGPGFSNPLANMNLNPISSASAATIASPAITASRSTGSGTLSSSNSPTAALVKTQAATAAGTAQGAAIMQELLDVMTSSSKGIYTKPADDLTLMGSSSFSTPGGSSITSSGSLMQPLGAKPSSTITPGGYMAGPQRRTNAQPFAGFGAEVDGHISEAAKMYGIPEDVLRGFVKMEGGWTGKMSPTGAIGTGQFVQSTWDGLAKTGEGQAIGMRKIGSDFRTQNDPRHDKRTNTLATGLLAKQNAEMLKRAGLPVTGENLYMMHNIGPGVIDVLKGKNATPATITAMRHNGMTGNMSATDFVAFQKDRFQSHYASANNLSGQASTAATALAASGSNRTPPAPIVVQQPVPIAANGKSPAQGAQAQGGAQTPMVTRNPDSPIRGYSQYLITSSISS